MIAVESVWGNMLDRGTKGSTMRMVESIPGVYALIHMPEFKMALDRGVEVNVIITTKPQNENEVAMLEEIARFTKIKKNPTKNEYQVAMLQYNLVKCYEEHGFDATMDHLMENWIVDGKKMNPKEAFQQAQAFEMDYLSKTISR